jgi:ankyrin repeat protein
LIEDGIDVDTQDETGNSLLINAVLNEQLEIAEYLISLNPDLYLYNEENSTVFPIAESLKDKHIFNLLLDKCLNSNDQIFLIGYHAKPKSEIEDVLGAFINCYIVDTDYSNALIRSKKMVEDEGWDILTTEEEITINRFELEDDDERKPYVDQVVIDKDVMVIYSYENEEDE